MFSHHVPLFFFVSGCLEYYNKDSVLKTLQKKATGILIPWLFFAVLSVAEAVLFGNARFENIGGFLREIAKGCIRNRFFAGGLWFLTALFCVSVIFQIIKQARFRVLILAIALPFHYVAQKLVPSAPSWYYNVDSALTYLVYFALGYCLIDVLNKLVTSKKKSIMVLHYVLFAVCTVFTAFLFFGKNMLVPLYSVSIVLPFAKIVATLLAILFWFFVAYELRNISLFVRLGKETLWFCGNEYLIKNLVTQICVLFGLTFTVKTPMMAILASFALIVLVSRYIVPWQKKIIDEVTAICQKPFLKKASAATE